MRAPLLLYLGSASEALPLAAVLVTRRPAGGARWVLAIWCAALVACDATQLVLSLRGVHNLWVGYVAAAANVLVLWALSYWQVGETGRLALRVAIVPYLAVWAVLTFAVDDTSWFSRAADPMGQLICLAAAAYTLLARSIRSRADLVRQGWFWASAGVAFYFGIWCAMGPLGALLAGSPSRYLFALQVANLLNIGAMAAIAYGVTCTETT